jgi:hypothetical protein
MELRRFAAYGFLGGVVGGASVVLFSHLLYYLGISALFGVDSPVSIKPPAVYSPLFWAGLWGIPFGMIMSKLHGRVYLYGFLYFLAPVMGLFLIFSPMHGTGYFALAKGVSFTLYLVLVNMPYGIVTAAVTKWLSAERGHDTWKGMAHQH